MTAEPYGKSPVFDECNLPEALRKNHQTKSGTWGLLRVLEGGVRLVFVDPPSERFVTADSPAQIPPQAAHYVVTDGPMKMQVEFYREMPVLAGSP
ncbi:MAG: DUF1971 domain-containing protein [Alphaproteobacteria bacterium]